MLNSNFKSQRRHSRLFKKDDLKYFILELLNNKSSHGYEIILTLEDRFHGLYSPNHGSIYPVLQLLEDMSHVTSSTTEGKKVYTITDSGKAFLIEHKKTAEQIRERLREWLGSDQNTHLQDVRLALNYWCDIRRLIGSIAICKEPDKIVKVKDILANTFNEIEKVYQE